MTAYRGGIINTALFFPNIKKLFLFEFELNFNVRNLYFKNITHHGGSFGMPNIKIIVVDVPNIDIKFELA